MVVFMQLDEQAVVVHAPQVVVADTPFGYCVHTSDVPSRSIVHPFAPGDTHNPEEHLEPVMSDEQV